MIPDETMCGTFQDWTFGGVLRRYRMARNLKLREFAASAGIDAPNLCNLENNRVAPPCSIRKIKQMVATMNLSESELTVLTIAAQNFHLGRLLRKWETD